MNYKDLLELKTLNEYQKSFGSCVTFEATLTDACHVEVHYTIPSNVTLIMDFDLCHFESEINMALLGKAADFVIVHLTIMKILMREFNSRIIGICLDSSVENHLLERIGECEKALREFNDVKEAYEKYRRENYLDCGNVTVHTKMVN